MDMKRNNTGFKLLELCKNKNLSFFNGRFGKGANEGMYIKGVSLIYFVIASLQGLKYFTGFDITELDRLCSDGHLLLSFDITFASKQVIHSILYTYKKQTRQAGMLRTYTHSEII